MAPTKNLSSLFERGKVRAERLQILALSALTIPFPSRDRVFSYVVIETQNLWAEFSRCFALSCVQMPTSITGQPVTLANKAIRNSGDVLVTAVRYRYGRKARKPMTRRDEPGWHDTSLLLNVCSEMGCSNLPTVRSALSTGATVFADLPKVRNFFAHRNDETKSQARDVSLRYALPRLPHPTLILSSTPSGRPQPLIADWIDDVSVTMELMCQ